MKSRIPKRIWIDRTDGIVYTEKYSDCVEYSRKGEELRGLRRWVKGNLLLASQPCVLLREIDRRAKP